MLFRSQSLRIKCDDLCKEYLESKGDVTYSLCVDYVEDYEDEDDEMGSRVLESLYIEKYGDLNNMEGQPEGLIFYDLTNGEIDQHLKNLLSFKKYIILDDNGLPKHEKETFDYEGNVFDAYSITPKEYLDYYNVSYELESVNLTDDITWENHKDSYVSNKGEAVIELIDGRYVLKYTDFFTSDENNSFHVNVKGSDDTFLTLDSLKSYFNKIYKKFYPK